MKHNHHQKGSISPMAHIDSKWAKLLEKSRPRSFPDAIVFDILSRLPVKSILRFKSVCKEWYVLFGETQFIESHLKRSVKRSGRCFRVSELRKTGVAFSLRREENFEDWCSSRVRHIRRYKIVASTNGIVCITYHPRRAAGDMEILLWNPATRELRILPQFLGQDHSFRVCLGFGFDSKNSDFKAVGILESKDPIELKVYSLKSNCWSAVKVQSYKFFWSYAVYVNDRFHWLGTSSTHDLIISFDVTEEKIIEMDLPELAPNNFYAVLRESPSSLGKSLLLCHCGHRKECQIWFMKEHGNSKSWTKLYHFPPHPGYRELLRPGIFLDNGEIIMIGHGKLLYKMLLYDPKNQVYKILDAVNLSDLKYKESLVSVKGGGSISNTDHSALISNSSLGYY